MTAGTDIRRQLRELHEMNVHELKRRWAEVFGEEAPNADGTVNLVHYGAWLNAVAGEEPDG